jgi:hypothetical protein
MQAQAFLESGFPHRENVKLTAAARIYFNGTRSSHRFTGCIHARLENCCFDALQNCHMYKN